MILLKTSQQIDGIRKSCRIVAYVLKELKDAIKPGITTNFLNIMAEELSFQRGAIPGFKNYRGFPFSICASKNEKVVHGFPDNIPLKDGDVLSIDFGILYKGWYGDSAFTKAVGKISKETIKMIDIGRECLYVGISAAKPYCRVGDISNAIQQHAEKNGYGVVRDFVGHGIGKNLHEEPQVPNFGKQHYGTILKPGAVIAIEPMITMGTYKTITLEDGWTVATQDSKLAVHFEHTISITNDGVEILTDRNIGD
jgi:methionyl aminopeptidase